MRSELAGRGSPSTIARAFSATCQCVETVDATSRFDALIRRTRKGEVLSDAEHTSRYVDQSILAPSDHLGGPILLGGDLAIKGAR